MKIKKTKQSKSIVSLDNYFITSKGTFIFFYFATCVITLRLLMIVIKYLYFVTCSHCAHTTNLTFLCQMRQV